MRHGRRRRRAPVDRRPPAPQRQHHRRRRRPVLVRGQAARPAQCESRGGAAPPAASPALIAKRDARPAGSAVGAAPRRPGQFGGHPLGDVEPQQDRSGFDPAHGIGETRPASRAGAPAGKPASGGGRPGIGRPCCSAQSRARIAVGARLQQRRQEQREAAGLHADRLQPRRADRGDRCRLRPRRGSGPAPRSAGAAARAAPDGCRAAAVGGEQRRQVTRASGRPATLQPNAQPLPLRRRRGTRCRAPGRAAAARSRRAPAGRSGRRPRSAG